MCLCRLPDRLNVFLHTWQLCGFSPLWTLLCITRFPACVNRLLQSLHSNGFSPEWIRQCRLNPSLFWKHFPHSLHVYLLVWPFICDLKVLWVVKRFSHCVHEYDFPPVCLSLCSFKVLFLVNRFSHTVHTYGSGLSSCACSVISLLSASVLASKEVSPVQYAQHETLC